VNEEGFGKGLAEACEVWATQQSDRLSPSIDLVKISLRILTNLASMRTASSTLVGAMR
jgi:hypothetical protein